MANLAITSKCNRHCSYCFAGSLGKEIHMSRPTYLKSLDFLKDSGVDQVRLLGGEPSQHPDFIWFVKEAIAHSFKVLVFSNGLIAEQNLNTLAAMGDHQLALLININDPTTEKPSVFRQQRMTLQRCGGKVTLGYNLHRPNCTLDFLLPLIDGYKLNKTIRLGLAHPCIGGTNTYLHPKNYARIGERVASFIVFARGKGVTVELDCGFVPCMFPAEFLYSHPHILAQAGLRCGPVPDLLPDGMAVHCYPLRSWLQSNPFIEKTSNAVKAVLKEPFRNIRKAGVYQKCETCHYRTAGQCTGGCLSATLLRFHNTTTFLSFLTPARKEKPACTIRIGSETRVKAARNKHLVERHPLVVLPYIDQPGSFWDKLFKEFGPHIHEVYFPLPSQTIGSGRPMQSAKYLPELLKNSLFRCSVLLNQLTLAKPVEKLAPTVLEELNFLHGEYGIKGVTVANLKMALLIKEKMPFLELTASVLMDIATPVQALMLNEICDNLVPASRIMRNLQALATLKEAFSGKIRLMVNESCLPGCPFRTQHFHEMGSSQPEPRSLCDELLKKNPWMRLTGSWILPQHLHLYQGVWDTIKLAGRVTLQDPSHYRQVVSAYIKQTPLSPVQIGGGPASPLKPIRIEEHFFKNTLSCKQECHTCMICRNYYKRLLQK